MRAPPRGAGGRRRRRTASCPHVTHACAARHSSLGRAHSARRARSSSASSPQVALRARHCAARSRPLRGTRCASSGPSGAVAATSNTSRTGSSEAGGASCGTRSSSWCHSSSTSRERARTRVARFDVRARRRELVERFDLGVRERIVGQPPHDLEAGAGRQSRARSRPSGELGGLHDARDRADVEADVTAADFAAPLDEHDAELAVAVEAAAHHHPIARLEHVQRQHRVREQHAFRAGTWGARGAAMSVPPRRQQARLGAELGRERFGCASATRLVRALDDLRRPAARQTRGGGRPAVRSARRGCARCSAHTSRRHAGRPPNGPCSRLASMRARIARGGAGSRSRPGADGSPRASTANSRAQPSRSSSAPPWNGSHQRSACGRLLHEEVARHPDAEDGDRRAGARPRSAAPTA